MEESSKSLNVLLNWLNTFDLPYRVINTQDLTDGNILLSVLNFLAPDYFLKPTLDTVLTIHEKMERFDDIKIGLNKFCTHGLPNYLELTVGLESRALVGGGKEKDWVHLLELVLLTSIKSSRKNHCIQMMMHQLSRSEQEWLMKIISQSLIKFGLDKQTESFTECKKRKRATLSRVDDSILNISSRSTDRDTSRTKYSEKVDELQKLVDALNSELSAAASKYELLEKRSSQDKRKLRNMETELSTQKKNLTDELSKKEQAFKTINDQKRELEEQLDDKDLALKTLERKFAFVQEEARDWENHAHKLKKSNEELKVMKTKQLSKKMEEDLEAANKHRQKVENLEKQEIEYKKKLKSFQKQVEQLNGYKDLYEKQITRVEELEKELTEMPLLKQQLKDCRQNSDKMYTKKVSELQFKLTQSEAVQDSLKQKLEKAHKDMQELEDIVKKVQTVEATAMMDSREIEKHANKIRTLEAELARTVPESQHKETVFALEAAKKRVTELSKKLNEQGDLQMKRMQDRGRIEELEKKNAQMNELLASFQRTNQSTTARLNINESEKVAAIKELQQKHENEVKSLKQQFMEDKLMHSREQRLMISAVNSISKGLLEFAA